ncbi:MAG: DNA polymerase III subunit [Planctomycetota bacterium]|jgi:DNA polymerase-3 subunit delta'
MSLKDIFCQHKAIAILQKALAAGKVPHAYIFAGPEGVGKFTTAREWVRLLLCENPTIENDFTDSCGLCRSCQLFEAGSHPDFNPVYKELVEFTRENKGRKTPVDLPIDVIREFLIEKVPTKPTLSKRKVFVVSEAERLNEHSQNALLKLLEEPPEYCCIIMLCTRMERLLPTTKSRCQVIRFGPVAEDRIIEKLREMGAEEKPARYFARLSQGSLGRACQWAKLEIADANLYQTKKQLLNSLVKYEYAGTLDLVQWLLDESKKIAALWASLDETTSRTDINRRAQKTLVQIIISALHDVMKLNVTLAKGLINFDQKVHIQKLAVRFTAERAAEKIADCYETLHWIESGVNEKLIFEQLLLNLAASVRMNAC